MTGLSRKQTRDLIQEYIAQHPNTTSRELGNFLGISRQRAHTLLKLTSIAAQEQNGTELLTGREMALLPYIARGYTNKQIAKALGVSHGVIKGRVAMILAKLGADNKDHAAALAIKRDLISRDIVNRLGLPREG